MKRTILTTVIFTLFAAIIFSQNETQTNVSFPQSLGVVSDIEGVFTAEQIVELTQIIEDYKKETSIEICIATITTIQPYASGTDYAAALYNYWDIGRDNHDQGILLVLGKQIRETSTYVGAGFGHKMSYQILNTIFDDVIVPEFKKDNFFEGMKKGLLALIKELDRFKDFKFPKQNGFVNDFEGLYSPEQISELTQILTQHETETSNEIVLMTTQSLEPYASIDDYIVELEEDWQIGKGEKYNSILIVYSKYDQELFVQIGSGLKTILKKEKANQILNHVIVPNLTSTDNYSGIKMGISAFIKEINNYNANGL